MTENKELRALIDTCTEGMSDATKAEYLTKVICLSIYKDKTPVEIFLNEEESKERLERDLECT